MTRDEVMKASIWMPRLVFKSSVIFNKAYKDLTEDEEYQVRKACLEDMEKERLREEELRPLYRTYGRW